MKPIYFKSAAAVWKFTYEGSFCRTLLGDRSVWEPAVSCIEDMDGDRYTEITWEEGEP